MSGLVLFFSFSGHTAKRAAEFAKESGAELIEVKPAAGLGKLKAYTYGLLKSIRCSPMAIAPIGKDLSQYSEITVFAPIWADGIAPPMLAALKLLPKGANLSLRLISASGASGKERNISKLKAMGINVSGYEDIKV
jgi:hypothetical protein